MNQYDAIILGAGGAGMMCALQAASRGKRVLLLDHAKKLGGKILISGGGRCNFTNLGASPNQYVSQNPHFVKSALARYPSRNFIDLVEKHGIPYHEKKLGQLFCDGPAEAIVRLLKTECDEAGAEFLLECSIKKISKIETTDEVHFELKTTQGDFTSRSLVIATGGLSIPKIGATGFGYEVAKQFGLKLIDRAAALDGFTLNHKDAANLNGLAGVSVDTITTTGEISFRENILFTHAGLSGPATLQASLHWYPGQEVIFNLLPDQNLFEWFLMKKKEGNKSLIKNLLGEKIAGRLADRLCELYFPTLLPLPDVSEKELKVFCELIHAWKITPAGTVGYGKAEVTRGGVDTDELSSKTMESKKVKGLYFIGEVVDVTGWLGGYNFQWAWASGTAAGLSL